MSDDNRQILVNGEFCSADEPSIRADSRGLMYGDGCFETFCAYSGRFFKLQQHLNRLARGLDFLNISYPADLKTENITGLLNELLRINNLDDEKAIIRMQIWRIGERGYASASDRCGYSVMASSPSGSKQTYRLATVAIPRIPTASLPSRYKFTNGINYIIAANAAREKGADDALMETVNDHVSETTIANVFWKKGDAVFTPSTDCNILPGITRQTVLQLLDKEMNIPAEEGSYSVEELKSADAVWICNSVKEIAPVSQIDEVTFGTESRFLQNLQSTFQSYLKSQLSKG